MSSLVVRVEPVRVFVCLSCGLLYCHAVSGEVPDER